VFSDAFAKLREATVSFVMSVRLSAWNNWASTGRISINFIREYFSKICPENLKFLYNRTRKTGATREDQHTLLIMSRSVQLRMISDKSRRANGNTHFMSSIFFFRKLCCLCDNLGKYCRVKQATDNNMEHAHCMLDT